MIEIKTKGEALDLPADFSIEIEDSSPIFNERGSQSVPATVPVSRRNIRLLNAPHRIDAGDDPNLPERVVEVTDGAYQRKGKMNITDAGRTEGITFNVGFDNSTAYAEWSKKKLPELDNLPVYDPSINEMDRAKKVEILLAELYDKYISVNSQTYPFAIFPIAVNKEEVGSTEESKRTYWEVLNVQKMGGGFTTPHKVYRILDGVLTEVTIPSGYGITPFLRVWSVLQVIFNSIGLKLNNNPFNSDVELSRLVVLNNTADAACLGVIKYSDILPDCTVEDFLNALWVRFGFIYNIDYSTGTVTFSLIKDIVDSHSSIDLTPLTAGHEKITYEPRQYVKLSAKTSIEGAAPANERFEDFAKGLDTSNIAMGQDVKNWFNAGSPEKPHWDGNVFGDYYDPWEDYDPERDFPDQNDYDPWDDRWDDRDDDDWNDGRDDDYDTYAMNTETAPVSETTQVSVSSDHTFIAREFVTGMWYRLDAANNKVQASSSGFFNWDPIPDGHTALDLSSEDECVPIDTVLSIYGMGTYWFFYGKCPHYLVGARHYHSYIVGTDKTDGAQNTPLAFMFAYTSGGKTIGRLNPEDENGKSIILDDGTHPTLSLLFQFHDGLFAKFWSKFDEMLRHGNRTVEVPMSINKLHLDRYLNPLTVYRLNNIRCLLDTATYSLPAGTNVPVSLKLRTIQPQGVYDIKKEQNIPAFSAGTRHLEWRELGSNFGEALDTYNAKVAAAKTFIEAENYIPRGIEGEYWCVDYRSADLREMKKLTIWNTDSSLPAINSINQKITRKYKARLIYDIYEIFDMSIPGNPPDWERDETPLGVEWVTVEYTVVLAPHWVPD